MNRKRVFLSLAIAPGLLIGGSRMICSNSPEPAFGESRIEAGAGDRLGNSAEAGFGQDTTKKERIRRTRTRGRHHRRTTKKTDTSAPKGRQTD
jgi:hypothetical protein